jgi:hypothetical protein
MCKLAANNQVDFVIASEVIDERGELITIPAYRWNRYIVVPPKHALARIENISLIDLAEYPILTYMLGLSGRSQLDKSFQQANLEPRVAFTATEPKWPVGTKTPTWFISTPATCFQTASSRSAFATRATYRHTSSISCTWWRPTSRWKQ